MSHSSQITLHSTHFETRTALRAHIRRIRNRWHGKGVIAGRDHEFLLELFTHHPEAQTLAPAGVSHFEVHRAPDFDGVPRRTTCIWVVDFNGSMSAASMAPAVKVAYQENPRPKKSRKRGRS